ncbi:MAG: DUF1080 domain-containing protein [Planctomycetes bacterium]|nr:DUF1080 domain-containing protein [Planctomycetota bacterium]
MRFSCLLTVVGCVLLGANTALAEDTWNFEDAQIGKLPEGWSSAKTGKGPGSVWKVTEDESAPAGSKVLTQTSPDGPNPLFNLCVADATSYKDIDLTASFKALTGKLDQGGGLVWRYKDANNYYVTRMNPLEDNFRVYKVAGGKRTQLGSSDVTAAAGKWHTIRVVQKGDHIQCYLNGKLHLDVKDDTFTSGGKVGLWTKADAVTSFDKLSVSAPK